MIPTSRAQPCAVAPRKGPRSSRPRRVPPDVAGRVPGLGRAGRGRPVVIGVRPARGVQGARALGRGGQRRVREGCERRAVVALHVRRRLRLPRGVHRDRDRGHGVHHLVELPPHHRGVPARRRWLHRREQAPRPVCRSGVGLRAARRLRADDRGVAGVRRRRRVEPRLHTGQLPRPPLSDRAGLTRRAHAHEPPRREGIGDDPDADLPGIPGHARDPDLRRDRQQPRPRR